MELELLYGLSEKQMYEVRDKIKEFEKKKYLFVCWTSMFDNSILLNLNQEERKIAEKLFVEKYLDSVLNEYNDLLEDGYHSLNDITDYAFNVFSKEEFLKKLIILLENKSEE